MRRVSRSASRVGRLTGTGDGSAEGATEAAQLIHLRVWPDQNAAVDQDAIARSLLGGLREASSRVCARRRGPSLSPS